MHASRCDGAVGGGCRRGEWTRGDEQAVISLADSAALVYQHISVSI